MDSRIIAFSTAVVCAVCALPATSQNFPVKPIRIITAAPGGGVDFGARQIAQGLSEAFGQQVIVENRGGSTTNAAEPVAKAPPDGYTLLFLGSALWLGPFMRDQTPYDPVRDFAPITLANRSPNVLVVHPSLPVKSVRELIALAKGRPGSLNFASSGIGASSHLAGELFNSMAGIKITHIPYRANAAALIDLVAGQVQVMFSTTTAVAPHMKSGRLRALAVTSAKPSPLMPGMPTVAATGLPGYEATSINGLFAPGKTPEAVVNRLYQETVKVLNRPDVKERYFGAGLEAAGTTPAELGNVVKSEMARLGKIIKDSGARAE